MAAPENDRARRKYRYLLLISTSLLVAASALYLPILSFAVAEARRDQATAFAAVQKRALQKIDPIPVRDAARKLHERLQALPLEERRIKGASDQIPAEITALQPKHVVVHHDFVFVEVQCTPRDWFGLVVVPENAPAWNGGDRELADGIWYWETP